MAEPILVTGGTGKTGRRVADALRAGGHPVRIAARRAEGPNAVRFDWSDRDTFAAAFDSVRAAYLVAPPGEADVLGAMRPGLDAMMDAGVRRLILLSASMLEEGGPMMGEVHAHLREHAPEWAVLRPSWFMQNLTENQHLPTILENDAIYTATGDGRVAFVDAADIASCAAALLTAERIENGDHVLTGPEALSYGDVARIVSDVAGRPIAHRHLSVADLAARLVAIGVPPAFAKGLAGMDVAIAAGAEDRTTDAVERITGTAPRSMRAFAQREGGVWRR